MTRHTIYIVVSWADQQLGDRARSPRTREYGSASTKQAAIRLAERVLPPDAEYIITTSRWQGGRAKGRRDRRQHVGAGRGPDCTSCLTVDNRPICSSCHI